jgi:hypothetical protein
MRINGLADPDFLADIGTLGIIDVSPSSAPRAFRRLSFSDVEQRQP